MASPSRYRLLHRKGQSSLSLPDGSYIYSLCQSGIDALAAISSDNSLRRFDRETLKVLPNGVFANIHPGNGGGVTCVCEVDPAVAEGKTLVATSGRDGTVKLWDARDKRRDAVLTATSGKILMPMQSNMELLRPLAALILIPLDSLRLSPCPGPLHPPSMRVCRGCCVGYSSSYFSMLKKCLLQVLMTKAPHIVCVLICPTLAKAAPITALTCGPGPCTIVAGTEFVASQSSVICW